MKALQVKEVRNATKACLTALALRAKDDTGVAWPSNATLGADIGVHKNTVPRLTRELAEQGLISIKQGFSVGKTTRSNHYVLNLPEDLQRPNLGTESNNMRSSLNGKSNNMCRADSHIVSTPLTYCDTNSNRTDKGEQEFLLGKNASQLSDVSLSLEHVKKVYHEILPDHPQCQIVSKKMREHFEHMQNEEELSYVDWQNYFAQVRSIPKLNGSELIGEDLFMPSLNWLIQHDKYAEVLNGKYGEINFETL